MTVDGLGGVISRIDEVHVSCDIVLEAVGDWYVSLVGDGMGVAMSMGISFISKTTNSSDDIMSTAKSGPTVGNLIGPLA